MTTIKLQKNALFQRVALPTQPSVRAVPVSPVADLVSHATKKDAPLAEVDPAWVASQASVPSAMNPLTVRLPLMSAQRSFNDNLTLAIGKAQANIGSTAAKLSPALVDALVAITKRGGVSPMELAQAEAIATHFATRGDPNASIVGEMARQIRGAFVDQSFLLELRARFSDLGRKDALPSLTADAVEATRPDTVGEWFEKHLAGAAEIPPAATQGVLQKGNYVICPVLGSLINEGSLDMDENGDISLKQFNDLMINRLGITPQRAAVTVSTGFIGNHLADAPDVAGGKFNINNLHGSFLDHQARGDTGILEGGEFHEDKLQVLFAHSSDGKTLCNADFAQAINDQLARDAGFSTFAKGTAEDVFEMAALINTFGTIDDNGVRRIDFETVRDLYQHRKLPSPEVLNTRKPTGVLEHTATMANIGAEMIKDAVLNGGRGAKE
jgi:hypothetical protein